MKLIFQNQVVEIEQPIDVEDVFLQINELLGQDFYYSHILVDGNEVRIPLEEYFLEIEETVNKIEIVAVAAKEFINDILLSSEEYLRGATPLLESLYNKFYDSPTGENYSDLDDLFNSLQWLTSMINVIDNSIVRPEKWGNVDEIISPLAGILNDFEAALEREDTVLIADLLSYEIKPFFEGLKEILTVIIDSEGVRHELD